MCLFYFVYQYQASGSDILFLLSLWLVCSPFFYLSEYPFKRTRINVSYTGYKPPYIAVSTGFRPRMWTSQSGCRRFIGGYIGCCNTPRVTEDSWAFIRIPAIFFFLYRFLYPPKYPRYQSNALNGRYQGYQVQGGHFEKKIDTARTIPSQNKSDGKRHANRI